MLPTNKVFWNRLMRSWVLLFGKKSLMIMGSNISTDLLSPSVPRWQYLLDDMIKLASAGDADYYSKEIDGMHKWISCGSLGVELARQRAGALFWQVIAASFLPSWGKKLKIKRRCKSGERYICRVETPERADPTTNPSPHWDANVGAKDHVIKHAGRPPAVS